MKITKKIKLIVYFFISILFSSCFNKEVVVSNQISKEVYVSKKVKINDVLSFEWEHSFEHILWKEYYKITKENTFELFTIAVEGFGAGIPAEMECTYRYENGMIYMENIKGSVFKEFNWINSKKQLKRILLNEKEIIKGQDLPERERIKLLIK
nr:DUF1850 domain-containing protein [uncultured Fusobacterium sp.]